MITPKKAPYANTTKDPDATISDINRMLRAFGINNYEWTTLWDKNRVELRFVVETHEKKHIAIKVVPPAFLAKRRTWNSKAGKHVVQELPNWSQSMRLMFWWLKAKVEAIAYGLREVEEEFLSDVIVQLPGGYSSTLGRAIKEGKLDIPALTSGEERT